MLIHRLNKLFSISAVATTRTSGPTILAAPKLPCFDPVEGPWPPPPKR
jgi:hypothetical protein